MKTETPYGCDICDSQFENDKELRSHFKDHVKKLDINKALTKSEIEVNSEEILRGTGLNDAKKALKPFVCLICYYKCESMALVKNHIDRHLGRKPHKCDLCPYEATKPSEIKYHKMAMHGCDIKVKCPQCPYIAKRNDYLARHMKKHKGEKNNKCALCDFTTASTTNLKVHMRRKHSEIKGHLTCPHCDYSSDRRDLMKTHLNNKHTKTFDFKCDKCDYACNTKSQYTLHLHSHLTVNAFSCERCHVNFKTYYELKNHCYQHVGYPFQCVECDFGCEYQKILDQHKRKHLTNDPQECNNCGDKFLEFYALKRHVVAIHKDDYHCSHCNFVGHFTKVHSHEVLNHGFNSKELMSSVVLSSDRVKELYLSQKTLLKCGLCKFWSESLQGMSIHVESHENDRGTYS